MGPGVESRSIYEPVLSGDRGYFITGDGAGRFHNTGVLPMRLEIALVGHSEGSVTIFLKELGDSELFETCAMKAELTELRSRSDGDIAFAVPRAL